jgi:hypothetical protein
MYTDFTKSFLELPTDKDLEEFAAAGCSYVVFYKPGIFPTQLDRAHGLVRYKAWFERNFKIATKDDDFSGWLSHWKKARRRTVRRCHENKIKVLFHASNGFNIGAHVYNENWFNATKPSKWVTAAANTLFRRFPQEEKTTS